MRRTGRALTWLVGACLLTGCAPRDEVAAPHPGEPPPRTTWALRHRVVESSTVHIAASGVTAYEEFTGVRVGARKGESCFVSVSTPGQGGPENLVGQKVSTRFRGRPALRNGVGAEGAYLMWQDADGSWVMVSCDEPDDPEPVDTVAKAVRMTPSSIALPFTLTTLPDGYAVAQIDQDRRQERTSVYIGRTRAGSLADSDLQIVYEGSDPVRSPSGRSVTVGGRPALLDEDARSPEVCLPVQGRQVCVGITPSDTGPYPDRSADIPTLLALAGSLRFARNVADRTTWLAAEDAFG